VILPNKVKTDGVSLHPVLMGNSRSVIIGRVLPALGMQEFRRLTLCPENMRGPFQVLATQKVWSKNQKHKNPWDLVRNVLSQEPTQTC
jgi:hypothetical protein